MDTLDINVFGLDKLKNTKDGYMNEFPIDLKRGMVISIKHPLVFEPIVNVIQKVEGKNIYFRLPEAFLKNNVLKGDNVVCQVIEDKFEYVLSGTIFNIDMQYPYLVQVHLDKIQKFNNNRKSRRYNVSLQSTITLPDSDEKIYAIIKNMSLTGAGAVFKEHINKEIMVNVKVSASIGDLGVLEFKSLVVRATPKMGYSEYGLEITEIDEKNKAILDKLIQRLHEDEKAFIAECLK